MCGISCIVSFRDLGRLPGQVAAMNGKVGHRGPDSSHAATIGNVALGHTRLSIIDLSERADQPMERDGHHLSYNGEIYNYRELRLELEAAGHVFKTSSDTEVLLIALRHWGMGALDRLMGMFAFAYLDGPGQALYLVRDRFGKKPLVYVRNADFFAAGSEIKQLLTISEGTPTLNVEPALQFLAYGMLNYDAQTFFKDITHLPAGHFARFDLRTNEMRIERWYSLSSKVARSGDGYGIARAKVGVLLQTAVGRRHIADVKVGACLSGGLDSSSIVAMSAGLHETEPLQTISCYWDVPGYDERSFSRDVVAKFGTQSIEVHPEPDRLWDGKMLQEIGYHQDQPVVSGSQYNEYCIFRAAHQAGLKVMLDGQGADEYFGGYGEFWLAAQTELLKAGRMSEFWDGISARAEAQGTSRQIVSRRYFGQWLGRGRRKGPHIGPHPVRWLRTEPTAGNLMPGLGVTFSDLALNELEVTSLPFQLHSEDRNSMRWSVESRLPFLDHELVEYVMGLPTHFKVCRGIQKQLLRDAVVELPERIARRRDKVGFVSPDAAVLFANPAAIRPRVEAAVNRLGTLVDPVSLMTAFDDMVRRKTWYDAVFYRIVSFDAWRQVFNCSI